MKKFVEKWLKGGDISARNIFYNVNSVIFSEMDVPQGMYVIESGQVKVLKMMPYTNTEIVLGNYKPNEFFGEVSLIMGRHRYAKAVAVTDCSIWFLDEKTFKDAVAKSQEFSFTIMRGLANKLNNMNEKQNEMLTHLREFTEHLEDFSTLWHTFVP